MAKFDSSHTIFLFFFHCNYGRILYRFRKSDTLVEKRHYS